MEEDIEERTVHMQPAIVLNEARFAEFIHKETDAGTRGADPKLPASISGDSPCSAA